MRGGVVALSLACACHKPAQASPAPPPPEPAIAMTPVAPPPPIAEPTPPPRREPPPKDPTGVTPPPVDADFAALPPDVRLPDEATLLRTHRKECAFGPRPHCEHRVDFDGDGVLERVFFVRARDTHHLGIAVVWAGGVSLLGADARMRQLHTDVYVDDVELAWEEIEADFEIERWRVAELVGDGFATSAPRKRGAPARSPAMPAPARKGGGVFLGNSDSSTILYWDGASWRRLVLF